MSIKRLVLAACVALTCPPLAELDIDLAASREADKPMMRLLRLPRLGQSDDRTTPLRTPDGQPNLCGISSFRTLTPLEQPRRFERVETLSPDDAAVFDASRSAAAGIATPTPNFRAMGIRSVGTVRELV